MALTGCGGAAADSESTDAGTSTESSSGKTEDQGASNSSSSGEGIRLVNNKAEISDGLTALANAYEEESGVHVEIETIDSKKDELGLTSVVGYYTEAAELWWTAGQHLLGTYLDAGLKRDDTTYLDMINDGGKLDMDRAADFAEMVELFNEYTDDNGVSGSYDDQVMGFASGKYAFVTQGSWIGASLVGTYADQYADAGNFEVGMIPYAFEEGIDTIQTNSPNWWGLYSGGQVDEAKALEAYYAID